MMSMSPAAKDSVFPLLITLDVVRSPCASILPPVKESKSGQCVIVPQEPVATAKWHPLKGEYLRRAVTEGVLPSEATEQYLRNRRRESIVIIGIESEPGQRNLDAILDVGDIDGIFIGPNDMTTSLGIPDENKNEKYLDVVRDIVTRSEARGVPVMVHHQTVEDSLAAIGLGARFVLHSTDGRFMQVAMQEQFRELREAAAERGDVAVAAGDDTIETV